MTDRSQGELEVTRFAEAWNAAERRGDTAFLEQALADDFVAVGPRGFVLTKREWLGRHQAGAFRYDALALDEVAVRVYDRAAVLIGRQVQAARYRGHRVEEAQLRTTAVLVQRGAGWRLVGLHMSPIAQPPAFAQPDAEGGATP